METVSIRKKANEAIIIQNSKRVFKHLFTIIIGMYCLLNFLSIKIDINLSYKFFSIWLFLVLFFAVRPALKRRGIKVFLKVNNQIIAYSLGEALNDKMVLVHTEKALIDYIGSYQAINMIYLQEEWQGYELVNREDDFGDEGLREAKMSYKPLYLLKKYSIEKNV